MKTLFSLFLAITLIFLYIAYYFYSFVLDLVLFSAFFLSIFAFGTFIVKKGDSADIFQPYYLISILLFLYSAASILYMSEFT